MSSRKQTKKTTETFLYQENGEFFFCSRCVRINKKTAKPLGYLPIYIPLPPIPETFMLQVKDKAKPVQATKWKFHWIKVCLPCAKILVRALQEKDISP